MGSVKTWLVAALLVAAAASYTPVLENDFVNYDDEHYFSQNPNIARGLSGSSLRWAFTEAYGANWFPLTWLSWMVEHALFGFDARASHLINLLFHLASTALLFLVFSRMTGAVLPSAFIAAVFALHPTHVESVAWAAERKDVLSAFFWIATMWAYARYSEKEAAGRYAAVLALFTAGLLAKPMVVTLPAALLLLDAWPLARLGRRALLEKIPMVLLAAGASVATYLAQQTEGAVQGLATYSFRARALNALVSYGAYLFKAVWPTRLSVYYPHPGEDVSVLAAVSSAVLLLAVTAGSLYARRAKRRRAYLPVGWFWFLGTLVPVIGLVQVGQQAMADRYTYLPYIGISMMAAFGLAELLSRRSFTAVTLAASVAMGVLTFLQVHVWRDSVSLFEHALAVTDENSLAEINLGVAYLNRGDLTRAEQHLEEAVRIAPGAVEAHIALGALRRKELLAEPAIEHYEAALRLDPDSAEAHRQLGSLLLALGDLPRARTHLQEARALAPGDPDGHNEIGLALLEEGSTRQALDAFREAIAIAPSDERAYNNLGVALSTQGHYEEALPEFERALELRPDYAEAHFGLGLAAFHLGRLDVAERHLARAAAAFDDEEVHYHLGVTRARLGKQEAALASLDRAIALAPSSARAHYARGLTAASLGDFSTAIESYERTLAIDPAFAEAHDSWGLALASLGDFPGAASHFRAAIEIRPDFAGAHGNLGLVLAESGRPDEAFAQLMRAIELAPENPDGHKNLGVFLARHGRMQEARESFERAVALNPGDAQARQYLESATQAR